MSEISQFQDMVSGSENIVFLGGAGVSTESGIPDFRSAGGLYKKKKSKYKYPPETMLSHSFFLKHTQEFYDYFRDTLLFSDAQPNKAHLKLAELEKAGKLKAVITQNIDGLHQKAGSKVVLELHGSTQRSYCMKCRKPYGVDVIINSKDVPKCSCGGTIKPDVVLYEEMLNGKVLEQSLEYIQNADMLIIGGTSLVVYPAAGLIDYYKGDKMVIINQTSTPRDDRADLVIHDSLSKVFGELQI